MIFLFYYIRDDDACHTFLFIIDLDMMMILEELLLFMDLDI